jgi:hypothetical protein
MAVVPGSGRYDQAMKNAKGLILDRIEPILLRPELVDRCPNAIRALETLRDGMAIIAANIRRTEAQIRSGLPDGETLIWPCGGKIAGVSTTPVECMFQWYSVSAYNYVVTIGKINEQLLGSSEKPKDYAARVIPATKTYRDKVGAHFEWSMGQGTLAEREISVGPMVGWERGMFVTNQFMLSITSGGNTTNSARLSPWGITETQDQLTKRYWAIDGEGDAALRSERPGSEDGVT